MRGFDKNFLLRLIGLVIFISILFFVVDLKELGRVLKQVDLNFMFLAMAIFYVTTWMNALRWMIIARSIGMEIGFFESFRITYVSLSLGIITPARLGEAGAKVAFFVKKKEELNKVSTAVVLERVVDVLSLLFFCSLSVFFFLRLLTSELRAMAALCVVFLIGLGILICRNKLIAVLKKSANFFLPAKHTGLFDNFFANFNLIGKKNYFIVISLTFICWLVNFFISYLLSKSVGAQIPFFYFCVASALASLTCVLPVSIGGLGTREMAYLVLLTPLGISAEKIVAFSLISTVLLALLLASVGTVCWFLQTKDIKE